MNERAGAEGAPGVVPRPVRVLIADDEQHLAMLLEQFLTGRGFAVTVAHDGRAALARLRAEAFDVALLDVQMPELDGLAVLRAARRLPAPPEVVVVTGNSAAETALAALREGAYDYLTKPYRMAEAELLTRRAAEKRALRHEAAVLRSRLNAAGEHDATFVTEHVPLRAVLALLDAAAPGGAPVLLCGEPGTGRGTLARRLHARSGRAGAFVTVDARRLPPDATLGRLFGHDGDADPVHAAGPGTVGVGEALADPPIAALAAGGTLLVRSVDALPRAAVARLLSVTAPAVTVGPALVAATTLPPAALARRLGVDLVDRLAVVAAELPPLRARAGDVPHLVDHFVRAVAGTSAPAVSARALAGWAEQRWPGNVAELRLAVEAAVARALGDGSGVIEAAR